MLEYSLRRISGPTEPVTLDQVRSHLNMTDLTMSSAELADLTAKITAARIEAENFLDRKIGVQVWEVTYHEWPGCRFIRIPVGPLISVDSITYTDEDGAEDAIAVEDYGYSPSTGYIWINSDTHWPDVVLSPLDGLKIRVTVGLREPDGLSPEGFKCPENIRLAVMVRVGTHNLLREETTLGSSMSAGKVGTFEALLMGDRQIGI